MDVKKLKVLIAKRQLSIEKLAAEAGVSPDVIYKAMKGRRPTLATIGKLAAALGVEPEDLLSEEV